MIIRLIEPATVHQSRDPAHLQACWMTTQHFKKLKTNPLDGLSRSSLLYWFCEELDRFSQIKLSSILLVCSKHSLWLLFPLICLFCSVAAAYLTWVGNWKGRQFLTKSWFIWANQSVARSNYFSEFRTFRREWQLVQWSFANHVRLYIYFDTLLSTNLFQMSTTLKDRRKKYHY